MSKRRVVVTGLGIVSPVGNDVVGAWASILAGRSGIDVVARFDTSNFPTHFGGEIRELNLEPYMSMKDARRMDAFMQYGVVAGMQAIVAKNPFTADLSCAAMDFYRDLPNLDFSRQILPGAESSLRVLQARRCGWSDLGTPKRLAETLRALSLYRENADEDLGALNLAVQHARFLKEAVSLR